MTTRSRILVCKDEYAHTADPRAGVKLADALRRTGSLREAASVATELLATAMRADALYTLGMVASDEGRRDDAERALRPASELHHAAQRGQDAAADLIALASIARDPIDQLAGYADAARESSRAGDHRTEAYAHIGSALQLSRSACAGPRSPNSPSRRRR